MKFKDMYEPIRIELENTAGVVKKYKTAHIDIKTMDSISDFLAHTEMKETDIVKNCLAALLKA
jgi:hypothetical protein